MEPLELIHSNIYGPMLTTSMGGLHFSLLFVDNFNCMTWVHCLAKKSQAFDVFKTWKAKVEKETRKVINTHRTFMATEPL